MAYGRRTVLSVGRRHIGRPEAGITRTGVGLDPYLFPTTGKPGMNTGHRCASPRQWGIEAPRGFDERQYLRRSVVTDVGRLYL